MLSRSLYAPPPKLLYAHRREPAPSSREPLETQRRARRFCAHSGLSALPSQAAARLFRRSLTRSLSSV